jgi:hypothetical protein
VAAGGALSNRSAGDPSVIPLAFLARADGTTSLVRRPREAFTRPRHRCQAAGTGERGDVVDDVTEANGTVYLLPCSWPIRPLGSGHIKVFTCTSEL